MASPLYIHQLLFPVGLPLYELLVQLLVSNATTQGIVPFTDCSALSVGCKLVVSTDLYFTYRLHDVSSNALLPAWIPYASTEVGEERLVFTLRLMMGRYHG